MKLSRKIVTAGVAGILAASMAASAWAAEPKVTNQRIYAGGVDVSVPTVSGSIGGTHIDDQINLLLDLNIIQKFYNYLPGSVVNLEMQADYYRQFDGKNGAVESRKFVSDVAGFINSQLQYKAKAGQKAGSKVKKYTFDGTYEVKLNTEEFLSLEQKYVDYLGGAHPNTTVDTVNIDLKTGKVLQLGDMFKANSNYIPRLNKIIAKQVNSKYDKKTFFDKKVTLKGTEKFYVTENADLVIVYPQYAVAPYSAGIIEFTIPVSEVSDIFNFKL